MNSKLIQDSNIYSYCVDNNIPVTTPIYGNMKNYDSEKRSIVDGLDVNPYIIVNDKKIYKSEMSTPNNNKKKDIEDSIKLQKLQDYYDANPYFKNLVNVLKVNDNNLIN